MSMKKTDLEKLKGKKLGTGGAPPDRNDRFGKGSGAHAHGKQGKARAGGVPLAVKLLGGKGSTDK